MRYIIHIPAFAAGWSLIAVALLLAPALDWTALVGGIVVGIFVLAVSVRPAAHYGDIHRAPRTGTTDDVSR